MPRRVDTVGQQRPGISALEIDPQAGAGKAGMADRLGGTGRPARPAVKLALPPAGAMLVERGADCGAHRG